jgi:predicted AlkP superfamily pyrophosphatase or phosphodiesterase
MLAQHVRNNSVSNRDHDGRARTLARDRSQGVKEMPHFSQACLKLILGAALSAPLVAPFAAAADFESESPIEKAAVPPKVLLISLDGAKPNLIQQYLAAGVLPKDGGLGTLSRNGTIALQNITALPSLTAVSHVAIATGSTAVNNDIPSNSFHPVAAPIATGISGFAAPIGGYSIKPLEPSARPTALPLWVRLRNAGKKVVAATWPGADGANIQINGVVVQSAEPTRVADYTVPFGTFGGLGSIGFSLTSAAFAPDTEIAAELAAAGHDSFSPVLATPVPFETFSCPSTTTATGTSAATLDLKFEMRAAAIDTTDDATANYDTIVFFEKTIGIEPGPFAKPATGPAYVKAGGSSEKFYFEGTGNKIRAAYFVSFLAPDLATVRFSRYSANFIPRNAAVLADVDDINSNVGFWVPQDDFRIPERLAPGFSTFPDLELEAIYEDQVKTFVDYQTEVAKRAIIRNPGADLVMVYIEEPDGSEHQFMITDPRQATNPLDANTIGASQDRRKIRRYDSHVKFAYSRADKAVADIVATAGEGTNVFVVSDHGFAPFHTAVSLTNILKNAGIDTSQLAIRTSGPAANIYVNRRGRESGGTVDRPTYRSLVDQIAAALAAARDPNPRFNYTLNRNRLFSKVFRRPFSCPDGLGFCTSRAIGQDSGDVFAILAEGYNFDGIQNPGVARLGDPPFDPLTTVLSVPNFYGAHGYDPTLGSMSATFLAAGPNIRRMTLALMSNIDVAPTITFLLGVTPKRMDGRILNEILK